MSSLLSSRRFPYNYLVMTSFQSPTPVSKFFKYSATEYQKSISNCGLFPERDRQCVQDPVIIHRNVLISITSHSSFMPPSCRGHSELLVTFIDLLRFTPLYTFCNHHCSKFEAQYIYTITT